MRQIQVGSTSVIFGELFFQDSSSSTGAGLSGLVFNSSGLTCYYKRNTASASVAVTLATMTLGTWATGGFKEVDPTNMKGIYDFCPPDAAFASGAQTVTFYFVGATNLAPYAVQVELTATNVQSTGFGLVNASANVAQWNASNVAAPNVAGYPLVDTGKWLGGTIPAVNVTGVPLVDAKYLLGTIFATPATAGIMDANVKNIANAAVSTSSAQIGVNAVNIAGQAAALDTNNLLKVDVEDWKGGIIPAVNVTGVPLVDLKYTLGTISPAAAGYVGVDWGQVANKTTANALTGTTISTSQAVASVSGAVGSVTGNVGGSVASVTGLTTANVTQINGNATSAGNLQRATAAIVTGTVGAASTSTVINTSALSPAASVSGQFIGRIVTFDYTTATSALQGQATNITASTAAGALTVTALTTAPASGDTFTIT